MDAFREADAVVVGAGVAGLACARELARSGLRPVVLGKQLGGRCATRLIEGQAVDAGLPFFHGSDPAFLAALDEVPGRIEGWPVRVEGRGSPCQPRAFAPYERRLAFADGVGAFPERLGAALDVRQGTVTSLAHVASRLVAKSESSTPWSTRVLVLALPVEQSADLLAPLASELPGLAAVEAILRMSASLPCLTVIAGYPMEGDAPAWDACYPDTGGILHLVSHDSAKRPHPRWRVLVYQGLPRWSRENEQRSQEEWAEDVLAEGARLFGAWASRPAWWQAHHWRFGRLVGGAELAAPVLAEGPSGTRLGLAGEAFGVGGGVQAAWTSGVRLAARILGKEVG